MKVLVTKVAGTNCDHIQVKTLAGVMLDQFTITEIKAALIDDDSYWLRRILKYIVKKSNANTLAQIKAAIEAEDF